MSDHAGVNHVNHVNRVSCAKYRTTAESVPKHTFYDTVLHTWAWHDA